MVEPVAENRDHPLTGSQGMLVGNMNLKEFRIKNYKSFLDSGTVKLTPGMNVVTGQNSAGKTALLRALNLDFTVDEHRSIASMPDRGTILNQTSEVGFTISISGRELRTITEHLPVVNLAIPPDIGDNRRNPLNLTSSGYLGTQNFRAIWEWFHEKPQIDFELIRRATRSGLSTDSQSAPSHKLYSTTGSTNPLFLVRNLRPDGNVNFSHQYGSLPDIGVALAGHFIARIYRFSAERYNIGDSVTGTEILLKSNASNLPEVLNTLQPNPDSYEKYIDLVREVLPQVKWVSVIPQRDNMLRILVWHLDKNTQRNDLAIPLNECGTGIGQVLSILYVAHCSPFPQVILIDEPQSFLHPGAARKLIEVLKRFSQHQYIISTHSSSIISSSEAQEILIIRNKEGQSSINVASTDDTEAMKEFLEEVGARLSDVFGMDQIIWVEGATEEKTLPLLLDKLEIRKPGIAIISIRNTGDFQGKDKKKILEIYRRLSGKASILPSKVRFVFDAETHTDTERRELETLSQNTVHFLPRRMFENYLLHPAAISEVVASIEGFSDTKITPEDVTHWFAGKLRSTKYWPSNAVPENPSLEVTTIDGAVLLNDLFKELSETRVQYQKTKHSVEIFNWIVAHDAEKLEELSEFMESVMDTNEGPAE